jgi:hypothetical protein
MFPVWSDWKGVTQMTRQLALTVLSAIFFSAGACQTYTSSLQRSVERANETAALALIINIGIAERTFSVSNEGEYATLQQLVDGGFLDSRYAAEKPLKDYVVTLTITPKTANSPTGSFTCNADPDKTGDRVGRHYYIDSSSDGIHVNDTQPATAADKLME